MKNILGLITVASVFVIGCAHGVPPTALISTAEVNVNKVENPDSMEIAPLEVKEAREHLDRAKEEIENKNYTLARRLAEQSMVDAQLAQAKTDEEKTKLTSEDATKGIDTLRQEIRRKTPK